MLTLKVVCVLFITTVSDTSRVGLKKKVLFVDNEKKNVPMRPITRAIGANTLNHTTRVTRMTCDACDA